MRKGIAQVRTANTKLSIHLLKKLESKGYKFVQVKGLTLDKHFDYVEPHFLILVPIKELPSNPMKKEIYEPIDSRILKQWACDNDTATEILISSVPG